MTLAEALGNRPLELLASDLSTRVLEQARTGLYPMADAENIPRGLLTRYCLKGVGEHTGSLLIDPVLRKRMRFEQINLNAPLPDLGEFEVIFLRNVMIYFDLATKRQVVRRMLPLLRPGGYFIVSHSESLNGVCDELKVVTPSIYRKPHAKNRRHRRDISATGRAVFRRPPHAHPHPAVLLRVAGQLAPRAAGRRHAPFNTAAGRYPHGNSRQHGGQEQSMTYHPEGHAVQAPQTIHSSNPNAAKWGDDR